MRFYILVLLCFSSLLARDNPFFPADPNAINISTSNRPETLSPFSKQNISLPNSARAIKAITITYQNLDGSISNEKLDLNNEIDWHKPFIITQNKDLKKIKTKKSKIINAKFISFQADNKTMKYMTKDKLLRNFMLTNPHRIVMDFSRSTSFKPKSFNINKAPFKKIRMGNHDKYYRVVLELDGEYRYKLKSSEKDLFIVCY
ncbi:MAG TPA: AMIN domain-containing protein [Sulfurimonas sp.]|nr:AMIN domain-containing protein [Sulfurimonas sp.]